LVFVGGLVLGIALPMASAFAASLARRQSYARDYSLRYSAKLPFTTSRSFLRSQLYRHAFDCCIADQFPQMRVADWMPATCRRFSVGPLGIEHAGG
jgi:hypothetical protein